MGDLRTLRCETDGILPNHLGNLRDMKSIETGPERSPGAVTAIFANPLRRCKEKGFCELFPRPDNPPA